ncbi:hypothetical protein HYH03_015270 [Edaphochlamys debaryana]|uniref:Uncharacterized protein n=1 Tax=Edaphochlamys debaryana TaxID=47281 RepID=A0A835XUC7_9CHLO|nr:hypothetical protein HYH03_015270 [Edaphochlamys debaryana]|eukprot:KAG2486064.1 hypothetical protein HYH03_015270 [Edaphochlamys debaryana]
MTSTEYAGISTEKIESALGYGAVLGTCFLLLNALFGKSAKKKGGRTGRVFVELQRKSFHMIGGCILAACYQWGMKWGYFTSAFLGSDHLANIPNRPFDGGSAYVALCLIEWIIEFIRLQVPAVRTMWLRTFRGLVREKEHNAASGLAYFLPGITAAMLAAPPNAAILAILYLSVGDAAASIGTAAGVIPVGSSKRRVEGSIGCFIVCSVIGAYVGLETRVALMSAGIVTLGEVLAEVIGLDDNFVIPLMGVVGLRIALAPQYGYMAATMGAGVGVGAALGLVVSFTGREPSAKAVAAKAAAAKSK